VFATMLGNYQDGTIPGKIQSLRLVSGPEGRHAMADERAFESRLFQDSSA